MARRIIAASDERSWALHSVFSFEMAGRTAEWMPETDYFITFGVAHPQVGAEFDSLRIVDGRIVGLHYAFGEPYPEWENPGAAGWLLPRAR
jgi:hypothetical protein